MKPFNTLSIVLGSLITVCLLLAFENLFGMAYFTPTDKLILNHELFLREIKLLPASFYLIVIFCNGIACYMGGMLPVVIGDEKLKRSAYIGVIVSLFAVINSLVIPFPLWYKITSVSMCLPMAILGGEITKRLFQ